MAGFLIFTLLNAFNYIRLVRILWFFDLHPFRKLGITSLDASFFEEKYNVKLLVADRYLWFFVVLGIEMGVFFVLVGGDCFFM